MKKQVVLLLIIIGFFGISGFEIHKFYVSIYQINYNQKKQILEVTSRIFIDDLNDVLKQKYNQKTHIGETNETPEDLVLMKKYILDNFFVKINNQPKKIIYLSKELEGNVVICYFKAIDISKIKTIEIENHCLLELNSEQQNIIQTIIYSKKQSLLLTNDNVKGLLKQ
jgi:hypothetical protein